MLELLSIASAVWGTGFASYYPKIGFWLLIYGGLMMFLGTGGGGITGYLPSISGFLK